MIKKRSSSSSAGVLPGRKWLIGGLVFSLMFLFYGSMVPLDFTFKPLGVAWQEFKVILSQGIHVGSRADLGENFLLMIPAGFFGAGIVWPLKNRWLAVLMGGIVLIFCTCSSVCIEFMQIYSNGRTPAISDIMMQTLGAAAGIAAWEVWGRRIWFRCFSVSRHGRTLGRLEKILWIYLIALFAYSIVPLDLTINPVSLYHKFKSGKVILIPFTYPFDGLASFIYSIITDAVIWIPVGFLWLFTKGRKPIQVWILTLASAVCIEISQLFIISRFCDVTDIIMAGTGGGIGILLCLRTAYFKRLLPNDQTETNNEYRLFWLGAGAFLIWYLLLLSVFWFPYEFKLDRISFENGLHLFFQVPFYVYYISGGLTAITAVFQKSLFFAPLGVCLSIATMPLRKYKLNSLLALVSLLICVGGGLIVELGQALIPNKVPDSTDLLFESMGGMLGYWLTLKFVKTGNI